MNGDRLGDAMSREVVKSWSESEPAVTQRIRIGDLLVRAGAISSTQLNAALSEQRRWGGRLGGILVKMQFVSESLLVRALSKQLGIDIADAKHLDVPRSIVRRLDAEQLRAAAACPVKVDRDSRTLFVAMADPTDLRTVDEIRFRTSHRVVPQRAGEEEIGRAIDRLFGKDAYPQVELSSDVETGGAYRSGDVEPFDSGSLTASPLATGTVDMAGGTGPIDPASLPASAPGDLELREHQIRHERALRVMVDLLIEKGVFSREEYLALLAQHG